MKKKTLKKLMRKLNGHIAAINKLTQTPEGVFLTTKAGLSLIAMIGLPGNKPRVCMIRGPKEGIETLLNYVDEVIGRVD